VLQTDELLVLSRVIVAPTSTRALSASFRPEVTIRGRRTHVLVEQLGAVDPGRLGRAAGHLSSSELASVDDALGVVLALR
jgi:mRNA interferase MazF